MTRFICPICGFVHDEASGELFSSLPDSWICPVCGAAKAMFEPQAAEEAEASEPPAAAAAPPSGQAAGQPDATKAPATAKGGRSFTQRALTAHRVFGYLFLAIYVILMIQMVPRLWTYQIEFPARTVVHLSLGITVGVMLLLKIGIVRWFRKLDQALVPMLGTSMLIGSVVLIAISVPPAFREAFATSQLFTKENQQRVQGLLAQAGLEKTECIRFSNPGSLRAGQRVLRHECIHCHDLRTVLAKPRTPALWRQTVRRMADRTAGLTPLSEEQQLQVTAYLTALSPQLQKSTKQLSDQQAQRAASRDAAAAMAKQESDSTPYDADKAADLVATKCSQCHDASLVADSPPADKDAARKLVAEMVEEGLDATDSELATIVEYLERTYVKQ